MVHDKTYKSNHHMSNLLIRHFTPIFIGTAHKVPHHVRALLALIILFIRPPLGNLLHVELSHGALGVVSALVLREGEPREQKVHWGETGIQVVVQFGKRAIQSITNLFALECARGGKDSELGDNIRKRNRALCALEEFGLLDVIFNLLDNKGNI